MTQKLNKVVFLELAYHNEVLRTYVHHFLPIVDQVIIFTNSFNERQSESWRNNPKLEWRVKRDEEEVQTFLQTQFLTLGCEDLIVVITWPEQKWDVSSLVYPCEVWSVVHNIHQTFARPFSHFYLGIDWWKDALKIGRHIIFQMGKSRREAILKSDKIVFPTPSMSKYYKQYFVQKKFENPIIIPFCLNEGIRKKPNDDVFRIIVPGNITQYARDYRMLSTVFEQVFYHANRKIELVLLGKIKDSTGKTSIKQLEKINNSNFQLTYFNSFVPQVKFDEILSSGDILLAPLNQKTKSGVFTENYGFSTETGNIADMVRYGLPGILPDFYPVEDCLEPMIKRYHSEESLTQCILDWMDINTEDFRKNHDSSLHYFSVEKISLRILDQWKEHKTKI
ncbi:MAG: glycosyltransferase [Saprospiraceae bacterium]